VTARKGKRGCDEDLALALARVEAAFGPVEVLEVRPNPPPASPQRRAAADADHAGQGVLDLDGQQEGGDAVA
jgi:hypothetical protein